MTEDSALRIAVGQFAPSGDTAANLRAISALSTRAADHGAGLAVLPEYSSWFAGGLPAEWARAAQPLDGEFVEAVSALARRLSVWIVVGMLESAPGGERARNTVVVLDPAGDLVAHYRKMHLYDAFGTRESDRLVPGEIEAPAVFNVAGLTVGVQTCYDLRFPEVTRRLVDAGAEVVLVPSEWAAGASKEHAWRTLLAARAIEDIVYVAAADHPAPVGVGASVILDPLGNELARLGAEPGLAIADVERGTIADARRRNPALELRRFSVVPREAATT